MSRVEPFFGLDGIYLMPGEEIVQDGMIEAWELFAVNAGQVLLQVGKVDEDVCILLGNKIPP